MIRNVVMGRLGPDGDEALLDAAVEAINAYRCPGLLSMTAGRDLGLRDGGWDVSIVADFEDEASYRAYDVEPEHNRIRAMFVEALEEIRRVQFRAPGPTGGVVAVHEPS